MKFRTLFKPLLSWEEPREVTKHFKNLNKQPKTLKGEVKSVGWCALLLSPVFFLLSFFDPTPDLPHTFAFYLFTVVFTAYVMPWMYSLCTLKICIGEKGVYEVVGDAKQAIWHYEDIDGYSVVPIIINRVSYSYFVIHTSSSGNVGYVIPEKKISHCTKSWPKLASPKNEWISNYGERDPAIYGMSSCRGAQWCAPKKRDHDGFPPARE